MNVGGPRKDINSDDYTSFINDHLSNLALPQILIIVTNFITIIIVLILFILFMILNSTRTLYINNNYPLYSDQKNLIINIVLLNLNPFFGVINYFKDEIKFKIAIIFVVVIIILILIKLVITYYYFSPLPFKFNYLCIFIELFSLFGCVTNIITYLTKSEVNSTKFGIIKASFELINALVFSVILIIKRNHKSMKIFSDNLFSTNYTTLNPSGLYYYISNYITYSKNKDNNYMILFKPIQNHVLNCHKKDCPEHILLPKSLSYSIFTDFNHYSNEKIQKELSTKDSNIGANEKKIKFVQENNKDLTKDKIEKPPLKTVKTKEINKTKLNNIPRKSINIELNNKTQESMNLNNKKILEESELKMIGEQEIINRIN